MMRVVKKSIAAALMEIAQLHDEESNFQTEYGQNTTKLLLVEDYVAFNFQLTKLFGPSGYLVDRCFNRK